MREFKIHFSHPNLRGMNLLPPAIGFSTRLLKENGVTIALFDATY